MVIITSMTVLKIQGFYVLRIAFKRTTKISRENQQRSFLEIPRTTTDKRKGMVTYNLHWYYIDFHKRLVSKRLVSGLLER